MGQNYRIVIQYEGTRYDGWQKQGNTGATIQGRLESVLERFAKEPIEVHGAGRTDAGVHARAQVANFFLPQAYPPGEVREYLNRYLPEDIAVLEASLASERFHARLSARGKVYVYQMETGAKCDVFTRRQVYGLGQKLDLDAIRRAAQLLSGTRDFRSFCGNRHMKKSTVRTLETIAVKEDRGLVVLTFTGNGFLQYMVRILVGTLVEVGLGQRTAESMAQILAAKDRQAAGFTAPAKGLSLEAVLYEEPRG